jgi:serine/threonine-protein kinase
VGLASVPAGGGTSSELGSVEQALLALEAAKTTARIVLSTERGPAQIRMKNGAVIDARFDQLRGRGALFQLLGAGRARYEVIDELVDFDTPLAPSLDSLLADLRSWDELSSRAPPLSAVLELQSPEAPPEHEDPELAALLRLVDARRTLAEVIDASRLEPIRALALAIEAVEQRLVSVRTVAASLFPVPADAEAVLPSLSAPPPIRDWHKLLFDSGASADGSALDAEEAAEPDSAPEADSDPQSSGPRLSESSRSHTKSSNETALQLYEKPKDGAAFVGRYEMLCRIGKGGMGAVYLCRLSSEGGFRRLFALKLLRKHLLRDEAAAQRFIEEARLAGQIHHPNVVGVVDAGMLGSRPYLVMDYVEGATLRELLDTRFRALEPQIVIAIVLDGLAGLQATHSLVSDDGAPLNVVHGDVSPENLLIGVDGTCRLGDFGVARGAAERMVKQRTTHGKPAYLAPEQVLGGVVDSRADIFAMGTVLYEALTGVPLFSAPTPEESLKQVCVRKIPLPSSVGWCPPPSIDFVCMKSLERDPARRFATAEEMFTELRRAAIRAGLLASGPDVAARVRASVGRQLSQRRLFLLEFSRGKRPSQSPQNLSELNTSGRDAVSAPLPSPNRARRTRVRPQNSVAPPSESMSPRTKAVARSLLIGVSVMAVLAVIAGAIWPEESWRLLSRITSGESWRTLDRVSADPE